MSAPASPPAGVQPSRAAFRFIFITVLLDMLAFGIIIPVLPKLIVEFEAGDAARAAFVLGVFGTVWALMQFLCSPLLGALSDRFGRRRVIVLSNAGLGADYVLMALAPTLSWLFVGRVISGITSASYATAGAYIADVTPPEKRAGRFGMLGAAFGIGFIIGPALGGLLGGYDLRAPFWMAGVLSLANAAYGYFVLPESLAPENRVRINWRKANPMGSFALLRSHPELSGLALASLIYYLAHDSLPVMFVLYADYRYGWNEVTVGAVLALVGLCAMIVQGGLVGRLVARYGERRTLFTGLIFTAISLAIYGAAPTGTLFLVGVPIGALMGLVGPSFQGLMTRRVSASEQGQLQGAQGSLMGVASMVAPALFTVTFATAIDADNSVKLPGLPYAIAAVLAVIAGVIAVRVTRPGPAD